MTAPFQDLRSTTLAYKPVAGPNYGPANSYLNQAANAAGGISIGGVGAPSVSNTGATQGLLNQAKGAYGGLDLKTYGPIAAQNPNQTNSALDAALKQAQTPESATLRNLAMTQIQGLNTAPDRGQLAARALQLQREQTDPQWRADLQTTGQQAAAMGRIGAGMTTTQLDDITLAREKALGQFGEQAAIDAAGQEMQDRLNRVGVTTGYEGQLTAEDLARAGFTQNNALAKFGVGTTVRGQNVDERNFQAGQALNQAQLQATKAGGLAGLVGDQYNLDTTGFNQGMARSGLQLSVQQAQANAAAARAGLFSGLGGQSAGMATNSATFGADQAARAVALAQQQQGFQADEAQQAVQNRAQQQLLQEQLLQGQFNRQLAGAGAAGSIGFANDPYQMELAASQGQGGQMSADQLAQQAAMARYLSMAA